MNINEILDKISQIEAQLGELRLAVQNLANAESAAHLEVPQTEDPADEPVTTAGEEPEAAEPDGFDLRSAFTINDRFRFCRELFGNSRGEMAEVIEVLSAMHSVDEIEDYLYNSLGWDATNPEVEAFITVVSTRINGNLVS